MKHGRFTVFILMTEAVAQRCSVKKVLKKRLWHSCFSVNFAKFLRTPFYRIPPVAASVIKPLS